MENRELRNRFRFGINKTPKVRKFIQVARLPEDRLLYELSEFGELIELTKVIAISFSFFENSTLLTRTIEVFGIENNKKIFFSILDEIDLFDESSVEDTIARLMKLTQDRFTPNWEFNE